MTERQTAIATADETSIAQAAAVLRAGGLVAFPTETVYGLGADATNDRAVAAIFEAKGRPHFNPLIVHFATTAAIAPVAALDDRARRLAAALWPGALTLVLPRQPDGGLSHLVSAGLTTVAVRVVGGLIIGFFMLKLMEGESSPLNRMSQDKITDEVASFILYGLQGEANHAGKELQ